MAIKIDPTTGAPIVVAESTDGDNLTPSSDSVVPDSANPDVASDDKQVVEPPSSEMTKKSEESPKAVGFVPETSVPNSSNTRGESKEDLGRELLSILEEYGGMESNIPINHEYWGILNKHRSGR